jgi:hypothetical protein
LNHQITNKGLLIPGYERYLMFLKAQVSVFQPILQEKWQGSISAKITPTLPKP